MKVRVSLSIGLVGKHVDVIDVPDDADEEEIAEYAEAWAQNYIDIGWEKVCQ